LRSSSLGYKGISGGGEACGAARKGGKFGCHVRRMRKRAEELRLVQVVN